MRAITSLAFLLIFGFVTSAQVNTAPLDSIVQNAVRNDLFEGTVLVAGAGEVIYHKSFGFTDADKTIPIENSTHFSIASITKMITAIIIMQMVEEAKFKLSDNLKTLLPEFEIPNYDKITVHHLLLHISGLPNENDEIYTRSGSPQEFVKKTLENSPNEFGEFNYANIDYVLLGLIIEKYNQTSWEKAVQTRILDRASMTKTGFLAKGHYPDNFAYTFSYDDDDTRNADPSLYIENYYAAGCMYSTAEDLLRLDQATCMEYACHVWEDTTHTALLDSRIKGLLYHQFSSSC